MLEKLFLAFIITLCLNLFLAARLPSSTNTTAITHVAESSSQLGKWLASRNHRQQYESALHGI